MNEPADHYSWSCPSCGRRVPTRFEECRCGFKKQDLPPVAVEEAPVAPASSGRGPSAAVILVLGAALGIGVVVYIVQSHKSQPATPASAVVAGTVAPEPHQDASQPAVEQATETFVAPITGSIVPTRPPREVPESVLPNVGSGSIEDVVSAALPAVASIDTGTARGTGFFVRPDLVITNNHVIEGQNSVTLQAGGHKYSARVMNASPSVDLALLQVFNPNPQQPTLRMGTAQTARAGEEVIAIGYALGALSNTVTRGIVSAMRQAGGVTMIQTDAAINPGNSGGPLLDKNGLVIGINSMTVARQVGEGLGFAIAIDHAIALLNGRTVTSGTTPLAALSQATGGPSDSERARARGEQEYEQVVQAAARNADGIDNNWQRNAKLCIASSGNSGDRPWFGLYAPDGIKMARSDLYDCSTWIDSMKSAALDIKAHLDEAGESARRDGVYPGTLRQIRQKYRMNWTGWDR